MIGVPQRLHIAMKMSAFTAFLLLALSWAAGADNNPYSVKARTVYHANGTHTESTQDPATHEQREFTYDQRNVLISKKVYLLNDKGQTIQGNVYDARDVLKARASFLFDDFGRMIEQRMSNLQGEVYQSISFTYDAKGVPLPPKSRTYSTNGPDMKAAVIDFTNPADAPAPMDRRDGNRGNVPRLQDGASQPRSLPSTPPNSGPGAAVDNAGDPAKKRSIWQRMFSKDKKEEKK
ncbi:MAG: hypothetical protein JWO94_2819 [Verrucomicrobiaceae bacterium]|nr:hypothetical protein [Verrucomicrobiaceae bacterium]